MNTRSALLFCCVAIFAIGATQDASSLSSDQLHQLFSQGNYTETLKQVRIVLAQPDQSTVDRFDLLKLKGEALLRTKSDSEAADAYRDAAKAAKSEDDASLARATELLLRQSHAESYMPKTRGKAGAATQPTGGISVIEDDSRKRAFAAMLDDQMQTQAHAIDAAKKATTLPPIIELAPSLRNLEDLERAANGSTEKSGATVKSVADHAREMITNANTKLSNQIDEIEKKAGQTETHGSTAGHDRYSRRRGLNSEEIAQLRQIGPTCDQISAACNDLAKSLGESGSEFTGLAKTAADIKKRADETAKKDGPKMG